MMTGFLDQLARGQIRQVDHSGDQHPSKIDEGGRRHYLIRAIPYQDLQQEAGRLRAVHEARVKIFPTV
jgi:hypothetical protein